jgi:hypothetical protein
LSAPAVAGPFRGGWGITRACLRYRRHSDRLRIGRPSKQAADVGRSSTLLRRGIRLDAKAYATIESVRVTLTGIYDGTSVLLDEKVALEANTLVRITLEPLSLAPGHQRGFLETARELTIFGPADWAANFVSFRHGPLAFGD